MGFYVTKISDNKKTRITTDYSTYDSLVITNSHATDAITVDLYATSQLSTDITTTGVYAAETEAVSTSSVALTVDDGTGSASDGTSDMFDKNSDELTDEQIDTMIADWVDARI